MSASAWCPPALCCARAGERPRAMMADVIQDRRVTVPTRGFAYPASVDGSRLCWALPSPVHEGLGVRASSPTGYKVMRCSPHALITAQSRIATSCRSLRDLPPEPSNLAPCWPPSRRGLETARLAVTPQRRPALTAAAHGASGKLRVGTKKRLQVEQRNSLKGDILMVPP
jgi:hypothetical protein